MTNIRDLFKLNLETNLKYDMQKLDLDLVDEIDICGVKKSDAYMSRFVNKLREDFYIHLNAINRKHNKLAILLWLNKNGKLPRLPRNIIRYSIGAHLESKILKHYDIREIFTILTSNFRTKQLICHEMCGGHFFQKEMNIIWYEEFYNLVKKFPLLGSELVCTQAILRFKSLKNLKPQQFQICKN